MTPLLTFRPYEIITRISSGGQVNVYKARGTTLRTIRVLKLLPAHVADDLGLAARFQRRVETIASLQHENIVKVFGITHDCRRTKRLLQVSFPPRSSLGSVERLRYDSGSSHGTACKRNDDLTDR